MLDSKPVNNSALVKFYKTLMNSGKEYSKWLKTKMLESDKEFSILFVTAVHPDFKIKYMKLYKSLTMIKILILEELLIK